MLKKSQNNGAAAGERRSTLMKNKYLYPR